MCRHSAFCYLFFLIEVIDGARDRKDRLTLEGISFLAMRHGHHLLILCYRRAT